MYAKVSTTFLNCILPSVAVQMNDVLEEIRNVIGEEEISGIPDNEIKDTIWYYHFDLQHSMQWCLGAYSST